MRIPINHGSLLTMFHLARQARRLSVNMGNIHYAAGRHAEALRCWHAGLKALGSSGGPVAASSAAEGAASAAVSADGSLTALGHADAVKMAAVEADRAAVLGNIGIGLARLGRYQACKARFSIQSSLQCIPLAGMNCLAIMLLLCNAGV